MNQNQTNMRLAQGADRPIAQVKTCPRCGARLFADMDVCYGCLYDFTRAPSALPTLPESGAPLWVEEGALPASEDPLAYDPDDLAEPSHGRSFEDGWDEAADQTALIDIGPQGNPHLGLLVRSSSMDVVLPLEREGITVGRGEDNDVVLHMRTVSRSHLRIIPEDEGVLVLDQGAINLAHANGLAVDGQCHVGIGGCIDISGVRMCVVGLDA